MWIFMVLTSLACLFAAQSTCTVDDCSAYQKELAFRFSCDTEEACQREIARELEAIVPSDASALYDTLAVDMRNMVNSSLCRNWTMCHESAVVREKLNKWARVPTSSSIASRLLDQNRALQNDLQNVSCVRPFDEASALAYDRSCEFRIAVASFESAVCKRRLLFSLRRELVYLGLLRESCNLNTNPQARPCRSVIEAAISNFSARISALTLVSLDRNSVLIRVAGNAASLDYILSSIRNRSCGRMENPCLHDALGPILALNRNSDVAMFRSTIATMQDVFFGVSDEEVRRQGYKKALAIFLPTVNQCGFHRNSEPPWTRNRVTCVDEGRQLLSRMQQLVGLDPVRWLTKREVETAKQAALDCWYDCLSIFNFFVALERFVVVADYVRSYMIPLLLDDLCDGDNCITAAALVSSDGHLAFRSREVDLDGSWPDTVDKVFWALGLGVTVSLIVACTALLILSLFVWKIWEFARFFCLFLGLVLLSCIFELVWWTSEAGSSYAQLGEAGTSGAIFIITGLTTIFATTLLALLSLNWMSVFVFLMDGKGLSPTSERIIRVALFSFIALLTLFGVAFGTANGVYFLQRLKYDGSDWIDIQWFNDRLVITSRGFFIVSVLFYIVLWLFSVFLLGSSLVGLVMLKKRGVSRDDLIGVVRLAIISFFLFVATSLRAANKFLGLGQVVGPRFFVYGITYVGATGVMLLMLFLFSYFALLGVHQQRGGGRTSSDMRVELLEESDTSSFFEGREVPKAYEV